jgi:hypothetical protein
MPKPSTTEKNYKRIPTGPPYKARSDCGYNYDTKQVTLGCLWAIKWRRPAFMVGPSTSAYQYPSGRVSQPYYLHRTLHPILRYLYIRIPIGNPLQSEPQQVEWNHVSPLCGRDKIPIWNRQTRNITYCIYRDKMKTPNLLFDDGTS